MSARAQRWAGVTGLVIGLGLATAPAIFQMYDRAPAGGDMMVDFEPYMTQSKVDQFNAYMDTIGAANSESLAARAELVDSGTLTDDEYAATYAQAASLDEQWATIDADMGDMLDRMERNLDNYEAVTSLPPFDLFPFFFVIPGGLIAIAGFLSFRRGSRRPALWALLVLGIGLMLAPVAFQMFTRAPKGAEMIDDFGPMMNETRFRNMQMYFITIAGGEGQLRVSVLPALEAAGGDPVAYGALTEFSAQWPEMFRDFNDMVDKMQRNIDNYEAAAAMPSFSLFPWFFLAPGVLVASAAGAALRRTRTPDSTTQDAGGTPS